MNKEIVIKTSPEYEKVLDDNTVFKDRSGARIIKCVYANSDLITLISSDGQQITATVSSIVESSLRGSISPKIDI